MSMDSHITSLQREQGILYLEVVTPAVVIHWPLVFVWLQRNSLVHRKTNRMKTFLAKLKGVPGAAPLPRPPLSHVAASFVGK